MNKTIRLKKLADIDVSKIFPVLNTEFYKLVEDKEFTLTLSQMKQLKDSGSFSMGNFIISKECIDIEETNSTQAVITSAKAHLSTNSLFMDELVESICHGLSLGENVMLYGRGGHNKSEGTLQVLKFLKSNKIINCDPYVKSLGDGTTVEDLFGGVKMKQALEEGTIEYNVENSFMNHEIVIFEECFDAPPQVLLALKDIMTSKQFRNGTQTFNVKTKCIIALTNKSKKEIITDDSIEALAQRFSITSLVEWGDGNYTRDNFMKLFSFTTNKEVYNKNKAKLLRLAKLCADTCSKGGESFISPRSAVKAAKLYCNGGSLRFVSDFDPKIIEVFEKEGGNQEEIKEEQTKHLETILQYINDNNILTVNNSAATKLLKDFGKTANPNTAREKSDKINFILGMLTNVSWHSSLHSDIGNLKQKLVTAQNNS